MDVLLRLKNEGCIIWNNTQHEIQKEQEKTIQQPKIPPQGRPREGN